MADFGEILRSTGEFGLFQKILLCALCFPNTILSFIFASVFFVQSDPERRCDTDWILRADPNLTAGEQLNLTLPREPDGALSRCRMFVPVDWDIDTIRQRGLNETTGCQSGWVYGHALYDATIVTDFDLVCDQSNMVAAVQTVFMVGALIGSFVFGPVAESFGRRRTIQLPVVLLLIFFLVAGLSPNIYLYMVSQFIVGAALTGYRINSIILATEWIGVTRRSFASCLTQMLAALGQTAMAGLAYAFRDWRRVQYVMAGAQAFVFLYIWWIPESVRWLLGQGRTEEAKRIICKVAAINKKKIPENLLENVSVERDVQRGGIKTLFTSKLLIKYILILSFAWFSINLGYFSLSLNVGKFGLSIFLVQFLFGISEFPTQLLAFWVLELIGRKKSMISTLLAGSLCCLLMLAFPQDSAVAITALATMGKLLLNWAGSVCLVYLQELFPTSVRQSAVALGFIAARVAGMLSPSFNMLASYHRAIPITTFSSLVVVSCGFVLLLPETRRTELPDATHEAKGNRNMTDKETGIDSNMAEHNCSKSTKL